jgi:8-amino-7-oxononanoate synthase
MTALDYLAEALGELEARGLLRAERDDGARSQALEAAAQLGVRFIDASSNDYLGYARAPVSRATLARLETLRSGAGASRLIHGTSPPLPELEATLAEWVGQPRSLLFSSGYAANLGALAALAGPGDVIVSDALNHASLIDGCRLSRARVVVAPHLEPDAVARALAEAPEQRRWVVTESYFSMDGDSPDLGALRAICDRAGAALVVDEAHALGVFGPEGGGLLRQSGISADVTIGTLGKAIGVQGAFVAGRSELRAYLWNRARSLVFSTGVSPIVAALTLDHVGRARADEAGRAALLEHARRVRERLGLPGVAGPIVPVP